MRLLFKFTSDVIPEEINLIYNTQHTAPFYLLYDITYLFIIYNLLLFYSLALVKRCGIKVFLLNFLRHTYSLKIQRKLFIFSLFLSFFLFSFLSYFFLFLL